MDSTKKKELKRVDNKIRRHAASVALLAHCETQSTDDRRWWFYEVGQELASPKEGLYDGEALAWLDDDILPARLTSEPADSAQQILHSRLPWETAKQLDEALSPEQMSKELEYETLEQMSKELGAKTVEQPPVTVKPGGNIILPKDSGSREARMNTVIKLFKALCRRNDEIHIYDDEEVTIEFIEENDVRAILGLPDLQDGASYMDETSFFTDLLGAETPVARALVDYICNGKPGDLSVSLNLRPMATA